MARKYPIVLVDGTPRQLPPGDTLPDYNIGIVSASSGLIGGGDLSTGSKRLDVALAAPASGIIFVGDSIGLDGQDLAVAATAQASGNAALLAASVASNSGVVAQAAANQALASGNAALTDIQNYTSRTSLDFIAGSDIPKGAPVGLDDSGKVQLVRYTQGDTGINVVDQSCFNNLALTHYTYSNYYPSLGLYGISYRQPSTNYAAFQLAQPSGSTFEYGPVTVARSVAVGTTSHDYDPTISGVVYTSCATNDLRYRLGTISGLTCTFYTDTQVQAATINATINHKTIYDSTAQKTGIWFTRFDGVSTYYGSNRTINFASGTTTSLGALTNFTSSNNYIYYFDVVDNPIQQRMNVTYFQPSTITLNSRTASLNVSSAYTYGTNASTSLYSYYVKTCYSPKADAIHYVCSNNTDTYAGLITMTGTATTIGTPAIVQDYYGNNYSTVYDSGNDRVLSFFNNYSNNYYLTAIEAKISGSTLNYNPNTYQIADYGIYLTSPALVPSGQTVVAYSSATQNYSGFLSVLDSASQIQPTLESRQNYLGTAQETAASGASVRVLLPVATDLNQTTLTPGRFYYVDPSASGYTTNSGTPGYSLLNGFFPTWSGVDNWGYVAKAVTTSGLLMLRSIQ